jgi:hypothetical protein
MSLNMAVVKGLPTYPYAENILREQEANIIKIEGQDYRFEEIIFLFWFIHRWIMVNGGYNFSNQNYNYFNLLN